MKTKFPHVDRFYYHMYCVACNSFNEPFGVKYNTENGAAFRLFCKNCKNFITKIKKPSYYEGVDL